ncbi:MAG TPA: Fe-S cluster assembly protein SufD [Solirubrobacteraceae bacterium]|nr:Fe-S cluster assembly protein SufD [Solirubrobacteraceae bacterium]
MASAAAGQDTEPQFLAKRRAHALDVLETLELPQFKGRPGWEFTDLSDLDLSAYQPGRNGHSAEGAEPLFALQDAITDTDQLPDGAIVAPLHRALRDHPELLERHLSSLVTPDGDFFVAKNEASFETGAFVYVPNGVVLERPVLLSALQGGDGTEHNRRTLVVLEEGAQAEVWEQQLSGSPDGSSLLNTVIELVVGDGARLRFVCGQQLSERSWIFGTHRAEIARDGVLDWVALGFGSGAGRVRMETRLGGPGAEARVTGAYAAHGRQHLDFDTTQEHAAPNTTSDLAFRGVLSGRATAVWKGNIIVDPGAQKTDAFQESRNLLISKRAHADAIPGLEIQANDVRCTHAAAVAQVDPEQLFYLRSHGLPENLAKRLVIEGFLAALVERFEQGPVRDVLARTLEQRLSQVLGDY